jgi:hypothetical protein
MGQLFFHNGQGHVLINFHETIHINGFNSLGCRTRNFFIYLSWFHKLVCIDKEQEQYCQGHRDAQDRRLKERCKFNFQTRNKTKLCDSKIRTHEKKTKTRDVQNKYENEFSLCLHMQI